MTIKIGNAPCSWGVEFADDPRNPSWERVLDECRDAGYRGIELGPVGFMPEDPAVLGDALAARELELIGGVVFRPFHDPAKWDDVKDGSVRTCEALKAHGARHLVLIDSISPRRAPTAGRPGEAEQMSSSEWTDYVSKIRDIARMGTEEYGLITSIHPHAGGFMDFEEEVERLLGEVDASILKICLDTGHSIYADFDPVAFMDRHMDRISYMHFKDIDPEVRKKVVANRTDFYEACGDGIFCNLGKGAVDFPTVKARLEAAGFDGWCTVEQDCDPDKAQSPLDDARDNRTYLQSIGFEDAA
ncbi:MAG: TIM barrel protein [Roseibium sp.]|uniref:TIM barrel protein n=1 Tax=Roseibium sp. TaxID=1936156 RepID=UPI001B039261|nr:TIM barrel protein [Roseibium sp.]MBO6895406.1 TIM barrel protein [Roseibium sp.]MBO6932717.1 TIM barrel protein [Roseibium sp.]